MATPTPSQALQFLLEGTRKLSAPAQDHEAFFQAALIIQEAFKRSGIDQPPAAKIPMPTPKIKEDTPPPPPPNTGSTVGGKKAKPDNPKKPVK